MVLTLVWYVRHLRLRAKHDACIYAPVTPVPFYTERPNLDNNAKYTTYTSQHDASLIQPQAL